MGRNLWYLHTRLSWHIVTLRPDISQNGTDWLHKPDEPFDVMPILADWAHGRNLPSFKSIFVGIAIGVNVVVDFFVRSQWQPANQQLLTYPAA
jgi:hypothetical protein